MDDRTTPAGGPHPPCPQCGAPIAPGASACPSCRQPLCPQCGAAVGRHWPSCVACGTPLDARPVQEPAAPSPATGVASIPACAVCGRQDETLRLAAFPYVFSLVVVTYRRAFSGLWCRRHRNRYWALSGLITAAVGWFGLPFGFVWTPMTLFRLARGGEQPARENQHMLQTLAGHKQRMGDAQGASRCLEEALRLNDDEAGRRRLAAQYEQAGPSAGSSSLPRLWPLLVAILGALGVGLAIGLLDYAFTTGFSALLGEEGNIFIVILSWTPWIAMLFVGGLALGQLVEWALQRIACRRMALGLAFAAVSAVVALYGTQQGMMLTGLVANLASGEVGGGLFDIANMVLYSLTLGGGLFFLDQVSYGDVSGIIYLVLILAAAIYFFWIALQSARGMVRWQQALAAVRGSQDRPRLLQRGWLAVAGVFACIACSLVSLPLASGGLSLGDSLAHLSQADDLLGQGEVDQAVAALEAMVEKDPDLAIAHSALSTAYARRGEFGRAVAEMEAAVDLAPEWGAVHALLGTLYYMVGETDLAQQEAAQAERLGADDGLAQSGAGTIYYALRDLERAETCQQQAIDLAPEEDIGYVGLARVYAAQGKYEEALEMYDRALEVTDDPVDVQVARGYVHVRQEDLARAQEVLSQVIAKTPEHAGAHAALSYVYYLQGDVDGARREAEEAVRLDPYDNPGHESLAFALHAGGELDRALAEAREAVRLNPKDDTSRYVLGLCYRDSGDEEQALLAFQTFLDLYMDRAYVRDWQAEAKAYVAEHR